MAKGKSTWKYNKLLTARRNYFGYGGTDARLIVGQPGTPAAQTIALANFNQGNRVETPQTQSLGMGLAGTIGSMGMAAASLLGLILNGIDDIKQKRAAAISSVKSALLGLQTSDYSFDDLMSDYANNATLLNVTAKQMGARGTGSILGNAFVAGNEGFAAGSGLGPLGAGIAATANTAFNLIGSLIRNKQAKKAANAVNKLIDYTNAFNERSLNNRANNLISGQMSDLLANYAAEGGPLFTNGGIFDTGLTHVNNGGSHESNPYEGVPMGVDQEGTPNLVEEGETIWNDYVFSRRLMVPGSFRKKYKLGGKLSFADASKKLTKESEERPNDPISQNGLDAMLSELAITLEELKQSKGRKYSKGGKLAKKYAKGSFLNSANLRYFPAVASGAMALTDALGLTNKPDLSEANALLDYSKDIGTYTPVSFNPIGDYLANDPLDVEFMATQAGAESAAARRAIMNTSGGNRGTAMAGILAADNNALNQLGILRRGAREDNFKRRQMVADFNRATNMFNAENLFKADLANQEARMKAAEVGLKGMATTTELIGKEKQASAATRSANLSNFVNSIGDIGRENFARNMIISDPSKYYTIDSTGNIHYKDSYYNLTLELQDLVDGHISRKNKNSYGGYLTIKRRRR